MLFFLDISCMFHQSSCRRLVPPGSAEASESPVLLPAAARRSDPPQQGAPAEERHVRQAHAEEQTQDKEDGEARHRSQHLPEMRERPSGGKLSDSAFTSEHAAQDCIISVQAWKPLDSLRSFSCVFVFFRFLNCCLM